MVLRYKSNDLTNNPKKSFLKSQIGERGLVSGETEDAKWNLALKRWNLHDINYPIY